MINKITSIRISFGLGVLSAVALFISNFALMDIQHGGGFSLEWAIMHISYAVFILFHFSALLTLARLLRTKNKQAVSVSGLESGDLAKKCTFAP